MPRPGFRLYRVIAESHGASVAHYGLLPDRSWECNLDHVERLILLHDREKSARGNRTVVRGILVNNLSNLTGAVHREEHLMDIVRLAERYRVPILADEIYSDITINTSVFHPMVNVAARLGYGVPALSASVAGARPRKRFATYESRRMIRKVSHTVEFLIRL